MTDLLCEISHKILSYDHLRTNGEQYRTLTDSNRIDCTYKKLDDTFILILNRVDKLPTINRPQEPLHPYPYDTTIIRFKSLDENLLLEGTLTIPNSGSSHPLVILISGQGKHDRNGENNGHKPFLVVADRLTRQGFSVFRFDERGVGNSEGNFESATTLDFADDIEAAIASLKRRHDIDSLRLGLIGHSEGAVVASMVAAKYKQIAAAVLLGRPGVIYEEIVFEQLTRMWKSANIPDSLTALYLNFQKQLINVVKVESDSSICKNKLLDVANKTFSTLTEQQKDVLGLSKERLVYQALSYSNPWSQFYFRYDPIPVLQEVKCPILIMYGLKDYQVPPEQSLPPIKRILSASRHQSYRILIFPDLNHLFQTAETGSYLEFARIEETFAPAALDSITNFLLNHLF